MYVLVMDNNCLELAIACHTLLMNSFSEPIMGLVAWEVRNIQELRKRIEYYFIEQGNMLYGIMDFGSFSVDKTGFFLEDNLLRLQYRAWSLFVPHGSHLTSLSLRFLFRLNGITFFFWCMVLSFHVLNSTLIALILLVFAGFNYENVGASKYSQSHRGDRGPYHRLLLHHGRSCA